MSASQSMASQAQLRTKIESLVPEAYALGATIEELRAVCKTNPTCQQAVDTLEKSAKERLTRKQEDGVDQSESTALAAGSDTG